MKRFALLVGWAVFSTHAWAEPVDIARVDAEIQAGKEAAADSECARVRALLATPQDPNGTRAFGEFSSYLQRYREMQQQGKLNTRKLSALYYEKKNFKDANAPAAQAFKLFTKATFPSFLAGSPNAYQVEDALLAISSSQYSGDRYASSYFDDEMVAAQKYLLRHPESLEDFSRYVSKTRPGGDWARALPKDRMARLDAKADLVLNNRKLFRFPQHLADFLRKLEEKDPKGENGIDTQDLMMRMADKVGTRLSENPEDPEAKAQLDFLIRGAVGYSGAHRNEMVTALVNQILEKGRAETAGDPVHRGNDIRAAKRLLVLDKLHQVAQEQGDKDLIETEIRDSLQAIQGRPLQAQGCAAKYRELREKGFHSISAPR